MIKTSTSAAVRGSGSWQQAVWQAVSSWPGSSPLPDEEVHGGRCELLAWLKAPDVSLIQHQLVNTAVLQLTQHGQLALLVWGGVWLLVFVGFGVVGSGGYDHPKA